jgi:hypothetical protein
MIFHPYSKCMTNLKYSFVSSELTLSERRGFHGRDRMVVGFTSLQLPMQS